MSIEHTAQVYTEMLNNPKYRQAASASPGKAFHGWDLTEKERALLSEEAKTNSASFNPRRNKLLNYLIRNQPLGEPTGVALGNAIGRHLGLPVLGPLADCDGGCCSWTGRIMFGEEVEKAGG